MNKCHYANQFRLRIIKKRLVLKVYTLSKQRNICHIKDCAIVNLAFFFLWILCWKVYLHNILHRSATRYSVCSGSFYSTCYLFSFILFYTNSILSLYVELIFINRHPTQGVFISLWGYEVTVNVIILYGTGTTCCSFRI